MSRPTYVHINLPAIAHNLSLARKQAPNAFIWAVIKANAYGHDIHTILPALNHANGLALLEIEHAVTLREHGEQRPILLLEGPFTINDARLISQYNLTPVIHETYQINYLKEIAHTILTPITIYLKVNTGMNRLGFLNTQLHEVITSLTMPWIRETILMTHFANANEAGGLTEPLSRWQEIPWKGRISIANSATLFGWSSLHQLKGTPGDMVRPGIALYGSSPLTNYSAETLGLQATMSFQANIIAIQELRKGERIGYGGLFTADYPMRIAIVACGYADGYPRHAPTGTPVWVEGQITHLIGCISMDMLAIDITHCPTALVGSSVELWGKHIPIDVVAHYAGTISYELMCSITTRVKRCTIALDSHDLPT